MTDMMSQIDAKSFSIIKDYDLVELVSGRQSSKSVCECPCLLKKLDGVDMIKGDKLGHPEFENVFWDVSESGIVMVSSENDSEVEPYIKWIGYARI
jgi:hypothetical protein